MLHSNPVVDVPGGRPGTSDASARPHPAAENAQPGSFSVLGTVPIWVLSGLRLVRTGFGRLPNGWPVGLYSLSRPEGEREPSAADLVPRRST